MPNLCPRWRSIKTMVFVHLSIFVLIVIAVFLRNRSKPLMDIVTFDIRSLGGNAVIKMNTGDSRRPLEDYRKFRVIHERIHDVTANQSTRSVHRKANDGDSVEEYLGVTVATAEQLLLERDSHSLHDNVSNKQLLLSNRERNTSGKVNVAYPRDVYQTDKDIATLVKKLDTAASNDNHLNSPKQQIANTKYISSTSSHWLESSVSTTKESRDFLIRNRFSERNERIRQVCKRESSTNSLPKITRPLLGSVHGIAENRLQWCMVPKVGTTFVLYHLHKTLHRKKDDTGFDYSRYSKRLFMVREPYGRLVSAYISKLVSHPKWFLLGRYITRKFRPHASQKTFECGYDVTFPEFIKFFLYSQKSGKHRNAHFVPIHEICDPCTLPRYDYVAHLETMKEDMTYILDSVNMQTENNFTFEPVQNIVSNFMNRDSSLDACGDPWCPIFERLWQGLQLNGHISSKVPLPLSGNQCDHINKAEMIDLALKAAAKYRDHGVLIGKATQKREAVAKLWAEVSLADRWKVRDALRLEFDFFGYDPEPDFVFPPGESGEG